MIAPDDSGEGRVQWFQMSDDCANSLGCVGSGEVRKRRRCRRADEVEEHEAIAEVLYRVYEKRAGEIQRVEPVDERFFFGDAHGEVRVDVKGGWRRGWGRDGREGCD